jgi:outer membrane protein OmpA-like peptidoglycan-associated protein/tetratricopeptide (TPR) repeat protein
MRNFRRICYVLVFLIYLYCPVSAQIWLSNKDIYNEAEEYLDAEEYVEALPLYLLLEKKEIINANIYYKIGMCYLNLRGKKSNSLPYLEYAVTNVANDYQNSFEETRAPVKAYLLLGVAYRVNNQPKKAIETFNALKEIIADTDPDFEAVIDMHIQRCENAILLGAFPGEPRTERLPSRINNEFSNYNPVLVGHDSLLYYMNELPFYDALMQVYLEDGEWAMPENITPAIGSDGDHILVGASNNGSQLFLYYYEAMKAGEIYTCRRTEKGWSGLEPLNENINSPYHETHASISADGRTLYFTSNRPGGEGGMDIYKSVLDTNGDWGKAENLGPVINTPYNEETPIINQDDNILYFSSQGHLNMGGYDIFHSLKMGENKWREPINMGSPVSTTDDDLFYYPLESTVSGLMSRLEEPLTNAYDIFRYNSMVFANTPRFTVRGKVNDSIDCDDYKVLLTDPETGEQYYSTTPEPDGSYELIVPAGDFAVLYEDCSGNTEETLLSVEDNELMPVIFLAGAGPVEKVPPVIPTPEVDTVILKNILFGFDNFLVSPDDLEYLAVLRSILEENPSLVLQIEGYTDAIGPASYNLILSKRRAQAVANQIDSKGIREDQLKIIGFGEENPVAINNNANGTDNPQGRKYNRRVEIKTLTTLPNLLFINKLDIPDQLLY